MKPRKFPNTDGVFSGIHEAEAWCKAQGFSTGVMCGAEPIGIKRGFFTIAKWNNLSEADRGLLDGQIEPMDDFRNSGAIVKIK